MATENDKINTGVLATLVVVGSLATLAVALGVDALVRYETAELGSSRAEGRGQGYRTLAAEQKGKLVSPPSWTDKGKELVSMPIDRAMQTVLADLKRDPLTATAAGDPDAGAPQAADAGMDDAGQPGAADAGPSGSPSATPPAAPSGAAPTAAPPGAAPTAPAPLGAVERTTPAQPAASAAPKGASPPASPAPVPPKPPAPSPTDG